MNRRLLFVAVVVALLSPVGFGAGDPQTDLMTGIRRGNLAEIEEAISGGAKVTTLPLCMAVQKPEILGALIPHASDVAAMDPGMQMNAMGCAVMSDADEAVRILARAGVDITKPCAYGQTPFEIASNAIAPKPKVLVVLQELEGTQESDPDALYLAALKGDWKLVKTLLDTGADVNAQTKPANRKKRGVTALHGAADGGHEEVVDLLLGAGADPNKRGPDGMTTLMFAANSGDVLTLFAVLDTGVDPDERDDYGNHAITYGNGVDEINEALMAVSPELRSYEDVPQLDEDQDEVEAGQAVRLPCHSSGSHAGPHYCGQSGVARTLITQIIKGPTGFGDTVGGAPRPGECNSTVMVAGDYELSIIETAYQWRWECRDGPRTTADAGPAYKQVIASLRKEKGTHSITTRKLKARKKDDATPPPDSNTTVEITTPSPGTQFSYDRETPGVLTIDVVADIQPTECQEKVKWSMSMGSSKLASWPEIEHGQLVFQGLPEDNGNFGDVDITATACGKTSAPVTVQIFYPATASNHPGPDQDNTPNWFYYWSQTTAARGFTGTRAPIYQEEVISWSKLPTAAQYNFQKDRILVSKLMASQRCMVRTKITSVAVGTSAAGIDCFAETLRHEAWHQRERHLWWDPIIGNKSPLQIEADDLMQYIELDADADRVPTAVENSLEPSRGCKAAPRMTGPFSCSGRPSWPSRQMIKSWVGMHDEVTDLEMNAYRIGWNLWDPSIGRADDEDWGVKQDKTGCYVHPDRNKWTGPCPSW